MEELKLLRRAIPVIPTKEKSASALIFTGPCLLGGVKIITDGTNDATVKVYDALTATGDPVDSWVVTGGNNYGGTQYGYTPVTLSTGLYISVSGTGAKYYAFYAPFSQLRT